MLEWLKHIDQQLFLFLNGMHSTAFDEIMWLISNKFIWIPLYLLIIYWFFKYNPENGWIWLIGIILLVIATDQLTSSILKPGFGRLRPCHDPKISHLVHNVKRCGGLYSFVSGHSANSFAIATFCFLLLRENLKYIWLLFIWAAVIAYSRVYLGVHYPGDILIGGIIGIIVAILFFRLTKKINLKRKEKKLQQV